MPAIPLPVSPDRSLRLMDRSVGLFLPTLLFTSAESLLGLLLDSRSLLELVDSREEDRDRTHSFWAGGFRPAGDLIPGDLTPELGLPRLLEDRGRVLVFLGAVRPDCESRDWFFRSPETEEEEGLARAEGLLSPLLFRDRDSLVALGEGRERGRVP